MRVLTFVTKRGQIFNKSFTADVFQSQEERAKEIGDKLQVDWNRIPFDEFVMGIGEEFEHTDITGGDIEMTAKIALAHLEEDPAYYTKLKEAMGKLQAAGIAVLHKGGPGSGRYPAGSGKPKEGASDLTPEAYKKEYDKHYLDYSRGIGGKLAYKLFAARIRNLNRRHGVT